MFYIVYYAYIEGKNKAKNAIIIILITLFISNYYQFNHFKEREHG